MDERLKLRDKAKVAALKFSPTSLPVLFSPKTEGLPLLLPEEVIIGHRNRYIAHRRYVGHLVRAVYEYEGELPVLLTVYSPYADRYFKGGGVYEDKIFKGS